MSTTSGRMSRTGAWSSATSTSNVPSRKHSRTCARLARAPPWVPPAIAGFLVVELAGTTLSEHASYTSSLLYLGAFGALAAQLSRPRRFV